MPVTRTDRSRRDSVTHSRGSLQILVDLPPITFESCDVVMCHGKLAQPSAETVMWRAEELTPAMATVVWRSAVVAISRAIRELCVAGVSPQALSCARLRAGYHLQ
jgi:hypothetical protein